MLDTLKNTKRIDILAERQYVKNDEARDNAMDMKSGKTTTGKPSTLPKIAISEGFFVYLREDGQTKLSTDTLSNTMVS